MQPKPKPESLDDLLVNAEHYANFSMRNMGRMPPTLFLIGANGSFMFIPDNLADEHAKEDFATTARLMCIAHAATTAVMALEAWMKCAKPGEKLDMTEPPSEAFDRQEVIVLMGEARDGQKQKFLPIIRSGNGKFFGFGESDVPDGIDQMKGRKNYTKTAPIQFEEFAPLVAWWNKRIENDHTWKIPAAELLANSCNLDRKNPNSKEDITHLPPAELAADILKKEQRIAEIMGNIHNLLAK